MNPHKALMLLQIIAGLVACSLPLQASCKIHYHEFVVAPTSYTRLCETKDILTVNGQFPGPTLYLNKGDELLVNVINRAPYPLTIHWHGLLNPRNPWHDGPEYITMCGVKPGENFTHHLQYTSEEGTLWYHAHSDWTRVTVHGAVVIYPADGTTYPFPAPHEEYVVVLGEWWTLDVMDMFQQTVSDGADFNQSDAYLINGQPGALYNCSAADITRFQFAQGKTYLLRLLNAAMTDGLFFSIANHTLTVVGRDGSYLKPFDTDYAFISPGQTLDIIVNASQSKGLYYMGARAYISGGETGSEDNTTTTALVEYEGHNSSDASPSTPNIPDYGDIAASFKFAMQLRSLADEDHPIDVPQEIDTRLMFAVSMNFENCVNASCEGIHGTRFVSSMNNISFANPKIDILEAYYWNMEGIFTADFPSFPPYLFNFTSDDISLDFMYTESGTRALVLDYNSTVELVLQGTSLVTADNHPMHLHGFDFYAVGRGFGNFDPDKDPLNYNLVDPPLLNTVSVPYLGWAAVRFRANNPGVWLLHCHFERHLTWGMDTVFIVKDGPTNETSMLPPPPYMPKCTDSDLLFKSENEEISHSSDH
ncbi:unnamed protein product [Victoria cruziana]